MLRSLFRILSDALSQFDSDISPDIVAHSMSIRRWRPSSAFTWRVSRRTMRRSHQSRKDFGTNDVLWHRGKKNDAHVFHGIYGQRRRIADKVKTRRFNARRLMELFYVRHNTVGIPPEYFSHVLLQNLMSLEKTSFPEKGKELRESRDILYKYTHFNTNYIYSPDTNNLANNFTL